MKIYADNAATTKVSKKVIDAMVSFFEESYANPSSVHTAGQKAKNAVEEAREKVADILNCSPREVYFTSGGTESDNQAIISAALYGKNRGKTHIITTSIEHHAVLDTFKKLSLQGFEVTVVNADENGIVSVKAIEDAIKAETALVSVMYANNEIGTIQPIREIGALCREKGVVFHTDAVQAVGHIPVDVTADNIDMLSMSAHKFHGPKGVGALYVRKGLEVERLMEGGGQERGKRPGTLNVPGIVGLSVALGDTVEKMESSEKNVAAERDYIIKELLNIKGALLNGDADKRLPGNVSFCFEGIEGELMLMLLDGKGIYASTGSACMAGSLEPSHVLLAIGRSEKQALGALRLSLGEDITHKEAEYIVESVKEVVASLR